MQPQHVPSVCVPFHQKFKFVILDLICLLRQTFHCLYLLPIKSMMTDLPSIDIDGKKLVVSAREISKLSTDGCHLQMVNEKIHDLDGIHDEDTNSADLFHNDSHLNKDERTRREYITLISNANRDPIKPGSTSRFLDSLDANDDVSPTQAELAEESYNGLHKIYENIGSYDEYLKSNKFEEVLPNLVYKRKHTPGVGPPVQPGSLVMYNCALWTEKSKEPFDSTWLRKTVLTTNLATDSILPGIHELLLTTKKGEICEAFIRPEAAFGRLGAMPRIPGNATIFCVLEVVRIFSEDKMSILYSSVKEGKVTFKEFFDASDEARRRGNYYYEQDNFKVALQRYKSGIRLLESLTYKNEAEETQAKGLLIKLYNNCARTANASGNPHLALAACKQASELDDMVPKTYWHRMCAWKKRGHLDKALGVARRAMQLFPDSKTSKPFQREADELKLIIQKGKDEADDLNRIMAQALVGSM